MTGPGSVASTLLAMLAMSGLARAEFVPPAEGPVPFRRDRLPVDADRMRDLSKQVFDLAGAMRPVSPVDQRNLAKILATALALDPGNRPARQLVDELSHGEGLTGTSERAATAAAALRETLPWLSDSQAGEDANALAGCLTDLMAPKDEDLPESTRWQGWIPELARYERKPVAAAPGTPPAEETPAPPTRPAVTSTPLETAEILMPLRAPGAEMKVEFASVVMEGSRDHPEPEPKVILQGNKDGSVTAAYGRNLKAALTSRDGPFPPGLQLDVSVGKGNPYDLWNNGNVLSGAAAVLMDAALSGNAPAQRVAVFASIDDRGKLSLPPNFWDTLRALPPTPGVRLVVPRAAMDYLTSALTIDGPGLFLAHQVVVADSVDELCNLCRPLQGDAADASARFQEVQRAGEGKPIGTFLATPAVVQRLEQIAETMPANVSARLLALQGSGNRPRYLPRTVLAREVRKALKPLEYIKETELLRLDIKKVDALHEECRAQLEKLLSTADPRDRDIQKEAVVTADTLRTLSRALKVNDSYRYADVTRREDAYAAAGESYRDIMGKLNRLIADPAEARGTGSR